MTSKRPTINDVARHAGVSKATVSAVLNDTGTVRDSTRDRVLAAIEVLNYRPSSLGGRAAARSGRSIGLLIKEIDNPYYAEIVDGAQTHANENGYTLLVTSSEGSYDTELRIVELLKSKDIDGLIVTPVLDPSADLSHLFELKRRNFPLVLLEQIRGIQASLIDVDNIQASREAVKYLIERGHTQIVHLAGPEYSTHSQERIEGVRRAYSESLLIFREEVIVAAGAHPEDGYRTGLQLFRERKGAGRPTAVTCYNDLVALGLCRALAELGIAVPDDVSVIGFDDISILEYLPVPLTTVHVPKFEMGETAARMLIRHIESREVLPPQKVLLGGRLVVRRSTRALDPPAASGPAADPPVVGRGRRPAVTRGARRRNA